MADTGADTGDVAADDAMADTDAMAADDAAADDMADDAVAAPLKRLTASRRRLWMTSLTIWTPPWMRMLPPTAIVTR